MRIEVTSLPTAELIARLNRLASWGLSPDGQLLLGELIRRLLRGPGRALEPGDAIPPRPITGGSGALALSGAEHSGNAPFSERQESIVTGAK